MKVRIFPVILLLILTEICFAQDILIPSDSKCGTQDLTEYFNSMNYSKENIQIRSNTTSYFPLNVFSVGENDGSGHMDPLDIRSSLCVLNNDFKFLDVQFYIKGDIKFIDNSNYYNHDAANGFDMMRRNNDSKAFNVYIVNSPDSTCGYFAPSTPAVAIAKNCFKGEQHALTHEMGHYLGLAHTFHGWENREYDENLVPNTLSIRGRDTLYTERVSGKYCDKASDGFCDTPPDYINGRWNCDSDGFSLKTYVDPDGVEFKVDGKNFMSYSLNSCQEYFSNEQATKMLYNLVDSRGKYSSFKYQFVADEALSGDAMVFISPTEGDEVDYSKVRLQWESLVGTTQYQIEVSRFNGLLFDQDPNKISISTTNSFVDISPNQLRLDTKYYWKITPLNSFTLCPVSSLEQRFITRTKTNTQQFSTGEKISLYPNLIQTDVDHVNFHIMVNSAKVLNFQLLDLQGKVISQNSSKVFGDENVRFDLPNLTSGMYLFRIYNGNDFIVQKIIVQ